MDPAALGLVKTADTIQKGGFPGTIRADEGQNFIVKKVERDIQQGLNLTKME